MSSTDGPNSVTLLTPVSSPSSSPDSLRSFRDRDEGPVAAEISNGDGESSDSGCDEIGPITRKWAPSASPLSSVSSGSGSEDEVDCHISTSGIPTPSFKIGHWGCPSPVDNHQGQDSEWGQTATPKTGESGVSFSGMSSSSAGIDVKNNTRERDVFDLGVLGNHDEMEYGSAFFGDMDAANDLLCPNDENTGNLSQYMDTDQYSTRMNLNLGNSFNMQEQDAGHGHQNRKVKASESLLWNFEPDDFPRKRSCNRIELPAYLCHQNEMTPSEEIEQVMRELEESIGPVLNPQPLEPFSQVQLAEDERESVSNFTNKYAELSAFQPPAANIMRQQGNGANNMPSHQMQLEQEYRSMSYQLQEESFNSNYNFMGNQNSGNWDPQQNFPALQQMSGFRTPPPQSPSTHGLIPHKTPTKQMDMMASRSRQLYTPELARYVQQPEPCRPPRLLAPKPVYTMSPNNKPLEMMFQENLSFPRPPQGFCQDGPFPQGVNPGNVYQQYQPPQAPQQAMQMPLNTPPPQMSGQSQFRFSPPVMNEQSLFGFSPPRSQGLNTFNVSPPARTKFYNQIQKKYEYECVFCKGNNQPDYVYKSHPIRLNETVICPLLRSLTCSMCGATGDNAHTIKYCPFNTRGFFASSAVRNVNVVGSKLFPNEAIKANPLQTPSFPSASSSYFMSGNGRSYCETPFRSSEESSGIYGRLRMPEESFLTKPPVVRKLNFDDCPAIPTASSAVFFKNLQQIRK